jgi:hypothetical protein
MINTVDIPGESHQSPSYSFIVTMTMPHVEQELVLLILHSLIPFVLGLMVFLYVAVHFYK